MDTIIGIYESIVGFFKGIYDFFAAIVNGIISFIKSIWTILRWIIDAILFFLEHIEWFFLAAVIMIAVYFAKTILDLLKTILGFCTSIVNLIIKLWPDFSKAIAGIFNGGVELVKKLRPSKKNPPEENPPKEISPEDKKDTLSKPPDQG
jgi:phage-related protein